MKTNPILRLATLAMLPLVASLLANCAATSSPVARHDIDGDGLLSDAEVRQANARLNLHQRDRVDEQLTVRSFANNALSIRDAAGGASDTLNILRNFGR